MVCWFFGSTCAAVRLVPPVSCPVSTVISSSIPAAACSSGGADVSPSRPAVARMCNRIVVRLSDPGITRGSGAGTTEPTEPSHVGSSLSSGTVDFRSFGSGLAGSGSMSSPGGSALTKAKP